MARQRGGCELCSEGAAAVHCESDGARLCWHCDTRVHAANFLVARHSRVLLCRQCRRPTSWSGAGSRLTPIVSLCLSCSARSSLPQTPKETPPPPPSPKDIGEKEGTDETEEFESDEDEEEEDEDDDSNDSLEEGEEEEGENQVVPWSLPSAESPPASLSSSSDSESSSDRRPSRTHLKRMREIRELGSQAIAAVQPAEKS